MAFSMIASIVFGSLARQVWPQVLAGRSLPTPTLIGRDLEPNGKELERTIHLRQTKQETGCFCCSRV